LIRHANLCDGVIAPSDDIAQRLAALGVEKPIRTIPTGLGLERFTTGDGEGFRIKFNIPRDGFLLGHVGRLAHEKNLDFLGEAINACLHEHSDSWFLVIGDGPAKEDILEHMRDSGVGARVVFAGAQQGRDLVDAYHAMDVFALASHTETQGLVIIEALAAGCPVVAMDATAVSEFVEDGKNERIVIKETPEALTAALGWILTRGQDERGRLRQQARSSAQAYDSETSAARALEFYREVIEMRRIEKTGRGDHAKGLGRDWQIWYNRVLSVVQALVF